MKGILTVLIVCALLAGSPTASGAEGEVITPYDLRKASIDNLSAAKEQYLNKTVLIKGVVISTGMSRYMTPNVVLSDQGAEAICVLPYLDVAKLSGFNQGQTVTMSGRVHNMTEERTVIKECRAVE